MSGNRPLERLFNTITLDYDRMNRILTLGMDGRWRRMAARAVAGAVAPGTAAKPAARSPAPAAGAVAHAGVPARREPQPAVVLDLCTGTGDLAYLLAKETGGIARIIGLDYSPHMLERAEEKRAGDPDNPRFTLGDATALPWEASTCDVVAVSFAFRNLTYRNPRAGAALAEIRRVLKPGGALVIVESSQPASRILRFFRDVYVELMVGQLVARLSGHASAYRYLADSVKRYYGPRELVEILRTAGFASVEYTPLFFGAAGLYVAS